ncbi:bifunctional UDP-N-acetylglucosamine diphosphorylase/glucosamine-1-phosphate N-acetyltransferase GlmU [Sandaracinus amylolyticus]|uniref:Bifunctional protein GlmU n=1 Tax=Sandaracinus amylolyticus TaxID=927083 RepID=A0A0F6W7M6_9BACT|nr:bifunctional UDP-N-acetylglucosamine diphosphorylase/glucosamine-1-phosphate N-acetyltransferase GlmU [Sandaracinus amylolyticus]AKF09575.1 N-acetylglucosamine-1-phosphate uridyltransferase [Sandaracinus amylolyticus]
MTNIAADRPLAAVVLAAGQGTRMKSSLPKVLHPVCGLPMVAWVVRSALASGARRVVVVVGHGREAVEADLRARFGSEVEIAVQSEQRGTGHAVMCGMEPLADFEGDVAILCGDVPLLEKGAIDALLAARRASGAGPVALLTSVLDDPTGYGRILRDAKGHVVGIREHKDASPEERAIKEWNAGVYCVDASFLRASLAKLTPANAQKELYLTDVVAMAGAQGGATGIRWSAESVQGVNDRFQLSEVEAVMRRRIARRLGESGVTIRDAATLYVGADVVVEPDAVLEANVTLRGKTKIGAGARIDVGCVLEDVEVAPGANLKPYTVASQSKVGEAAQVGPFSHLRPDSELGPDVHVGNFVELKKTRMGRGSKANHLAYLGDGLVGEKVNVGAGTIFCNYDGYRKSTTILEDGAFIGSDSHLVAPVRVGKGAYVATGTTVTKDVPDDALAVGRAKQENKLGYASRLKAKLKSAADADKAEKQKK